MLRVADFASLPALSPALSAQLAASTRLLTCVVSCLVVRSQHLYQEMLVYDENSLVGRRVGFEFGQQVRRLWFEIHPMPSSCALSSVLGVMSQLLCCLLQ
jgi:hypothetical protein